VSLADVLRAAAEGRPPEPDGSVDVMPQHGRAAGVVAFSAHFVVSADVDHQWVRDQLPPGDFSAPLGARFLVALADRIGADIGSIDAVLAATGGGDGSAEDVADGLEEIEAREHPRVVRALRYRDDVRVWRTPDGAGHLIVGRGLAGRWETAFEVEPVARGRGLGHRLAAAAPALVPAGEPVWAQVAPGNAASLRAVLAAGYQPVCAEVLLPPRDPGAST
jgi:GNAT superfamily N-acetyltransferase